MLISQHNGKCGGGQGCGNPGDTNFLGKHYFFPRHLHTLVTRTSIYDLNLGDIPSVNPATRQVWTKVLFHC